jgi:capsular polysaccharide biosynthesis protein
VTYQAGPPRVTDEGSAPPNVPTARSPEDSTPQAGTRHNSPAAADALAALWRARLWIVVSVVAAVLGTGAVSASIPGVYESSVDVAVNLPATSQQSLTATNLIAAQYALVVTLPPVVEPAAAALGISSAKLASRTSGGTVAGQNVIRVTVGWDSPTIARRATAAIGESLVRYIGADMRDRAASYANAVAAQLAPLDTQIADERARVAKLRGAAGRSPDTAQQSQISAADLLINTLTERRAALVIQAAVGSENQRAQAQALGTAAPAHKVAPQPLLYSLVAAVVALIVASQVALVIARRGRRASHRTAVA